VPRALARALRVAAVPLGPRAARGRSATLALTPEVAQVPTRSPRAAEPKHVSTCRRSGGKPAAERVDLRSMRPVLAPKLCRQHEADVREQSVSRARRKQHPALMFCFVGSG
jgi:hypothetical protein